MTQPGQSQDLDIDGMGFFAPLKSRVRRERFRTIDDLIEGPQRLFGEYDSATLKGHSRVSRKGTAESQDVRRGNCRARDERFRGETHFSHEDERAEVRGYLTQIVSGSSRRLHEECATLCVRW